MGCDVGIFGMALGRWGDFSNFLRRGLGLTGLAPKKRRGSIIPPMQSPTPPTPAAHAGVTASAPIVLATLNAKFIHTLLLGSRGGQFLAGPNGLFENFDESRHDQGRLPLGWVDDAHELLELGRIDADGAQCPVRHFAADGHL